MQRALGRWPAVAAACLVGCGYFADHYLVHPKRPPTGVISWSDEFTRDHLRIHVQGARPDGDGPFPTVVVHPEGGKTAAHMEGIIWDLAGRGYLAVAADYERRIDGAYRRNMFAWRSVADATAIVDVISAYPEVDPACVGVLGFSQGGVYSLLIAAHAPHRISAVVSYYPVTDFPGWLAQEHSGLAKRFVFSVIRWYFRRESGATTDAEFASMLRAASAYYSADTIAAPVLLVHGDHDTTAPVRESERMAARLRALGKPARLLVVPGGVHIFNFRQPREAAAAWAVTVAWLDDHLCPDASLQD